MWGIVKKLLLVVPVLGVLFIAQPSQADASWSVNVGIGDRVGPHHRHSGLPHGYRTLHFHNHAYYYYNGVYYSGAPGRYVIVNPPIGVIVSDIPFGYRQTWVNGRVYYEYNGTYYMPGLAGYQVVQPPVQYVAPAVSSNSGNAPTNITVNDQEDLTVNIPNSQGSFTPVVLKRSANGYLGPQGEFYSEFPKVAQLKVMYVK